MDARAGKYELETTPDVAAVPRRLAVIPERTPARFEQERPVGRLVMSFPHLVIRIMICFMVVTVVMAILAIFIDAPLEELADPQHTPNPAKAPWYFLGLQELLHYFPPLLAGIVLPGLVVVALIVVPYFNVNVEGPALWEANQRQKLVVLTASVAIIAVISLWFHAYAIAVPTVLLYCASLIPLLTPERTGWIGWLRRRPLSHWIMIWFVVLASLLTVIGTYFRGAGWSWVWPWD